MSDAERGGLRAEVYPPGPWRRDAQKNARREAGLKIPLEMRRGESLAPD